MLVITVVFTAAQLAGYLARTNWLRMIGSVYCEKHANWDSSSYDCLEEIHFFAWGTR
jgi:hypothetical protein